MHPLRQARNRAFFFFVGAVRNDMITSHDGILNLFSLNCYLRYHTEACRVSELKAHDPAIYCVVRGENMESERISGMIREASANT